MSFGTWYGKTLYFTSNRPGGYGGTDIWFSKREGNAWGPAKNLGPSINTARSEEACVITPNQKTVRVAVSSAGPFVPPTINTVKDQTYPIARPLYMYTRGEPTGTAKGYLDWILSAEGQSIVAELGFVPLTIS